jgi:adenylate cyclase
MDPDARQRQLMGLTKRLTHASSARQPAVNLFEDLHWIDPASELFLTNHVDAIQGTRSLTIVNFRPEYRSAWMSKSYYRQIALAPLGAAATEALLDDLLGADPSLNELLETILKRTAGNPFFVEEVVQSLIEGSSLEGERGAYRLVRPVDATGVPATVQPVLSSRIDRLGEREKRVLQAAAVIGQEFAEPVLRRVLELDGSELEEALRELVASEFVYEQELYPEAVYAFKHPLTQEVAFGSQLGERRATVHAAVARAIAEQYPERLDERSALLAQHWELAGDKLEAARWHAHAAQWAGTTDPSQSITHWRKVREFGDALGESAEITALGLTARSFLLQYGWRLGISPEEAEGLFREAEQMASKAGDIRSRALLLSGYGQIKCVSEGDLAEAAQLVRQASALAEESGDPALTMALITTNSYVIFCVGEYREALAALDRAIELAGGDPSVGVGITTGCPLAFCHTFKGALLAALGEIDEGRHQNELGLTMAREQGDIETVGWANSFHAWLDYFAGEPEALYAHSQQFVEIAERIGDSFSRSWAWFWVGWAEQQRGEWQPAIAALERSRAISTEHRSAVEGDSSRLTTLADAYLGAGDVPRARGLAEEAVALAQARHQPHFEIQGALTLVRVMLASAEPADRAEIEALLVRTMEMVRDTETKAYEPMVHVELAELARQGGDEDARERELHEAHRLFTTIGATGHAERLAIELATAAP